ncbi:MAG: phosphatidate cytidylyltransferase [Acidobacteriota bacterium]
MLRVASAAVLLAVLLAAVWLGPFQAAMALVIVAAALAGSELATMSSRIGARVPPIFVAIASAVVAMAFVVSLGAAPHDPGILAGVLAALLLTAGVLTLAGGPPEPAAVTRAAVMVLTPIYVGIPLGAVAWVQLTAGPAATTWLVAVIAMSDTAQYYTGRAFGRRKLAPTISPAKTVEGAIGGVVAGTIAGAALARVCLPDVPLVTAGVLTLVLVFFGIAGDLFESLLKRSAGVKDSSNLIPGHGGVLDRIDSHLFAAPVFFLFLRYVA